MGMIDRDDAVLARMRSPLPSMPDGALDAMAGSAPNQQRATGRTLAFKDSGNGGLGWIAAILVVMTAMAYVVWLVLR